MGEDRGHYSIVAYSNVGIELGTQICTAAELSSNEFTYEGFSFVSTDGGNTWLNEDNIEYAVAPPLALRKGVSDKYYICYQNDDLAVIKFNSGLTFNLAMSQTGYRFAVNSQTPSEFNVGAPMVDLGGNIAPFDYELYHFEPTSSGEAWIVSPAVTE